MSRCCLAVALLLFACPARADEPNRPNPWIPVFFLRGGMGFPDLLGGSLSAAIRWVEVEAGAGASPAHSGRFVRGGPRLVWSEGSREKLFGTSRVEVSSSLLAGARDLTYSFSSERAFHVVANVQTRAMLLWGRIGGGLEVCVGAARLREGWLPDFALRAGVVF